jgi:hypothetical protein
MPCGISEELLESWIPNGMMWIMETGKVINWIENCSVFCRHFNAGFFAPVQRLQIGLHF